MAKQSFLIPLAIFLALVLILGLGFTLDDPHRLPSVRVGQPFPEFSLPDLTKPEIERTEGDLKGPALVNVWATWCPTCYAEHEALKVIEQTGVRIFGINYADDADKARAFLSDLGDPYVLNVVDADGRLAIDLGVYGAPETFVIDREGHILYRHVGAVDARVWQETLSPMIQSLAGAGSG